MATSSYFIEGVPHWVKIFRNPKGWMYPYSLSVKDSGTWGIFSQHRKLKSARIAGQKVAVKYKTGHQALTEN